MMDDYGNELPFAGKMLRANLRFMLDGRTEAEDVEAVVLHFYGMVEA